MTYSIKKLINDTGFKDVSQRNPVQESEQGFEGCFDE